MRQAQEYTADAYRIVTDKYAIAYAVLGWETAPDADTEWTGEEADTGKLCVCMIGDDHVFTVDPEDVEEIDPESFCRDCGQIGCTHNTYA